MTVVFAQVFMETLRLYPPAIGASKEASKGLTLSNYEIPEGTAITVRKIVCRWYLLSFFWWLPIAQYW